MKKLGLVLLASLVTACSSSDNFITDSFRSWDTQFADEAKITAQLRSPQVTPVSLNNLPLQLLSVDNTNDIEITDKSPIVHFPEGNSFVAALLLPERINKFTFNLESVAGRTVFVPSVIFLNEQLEEVARADTVEIDGKWNFSIEKAFSTEMTQDMHYILVYTKDSVLDGKTELPDLAREYEETKGNDLSELSYPRSYSRHSPVGFMRVRLTDVFYTAQTIKDEKTQQKIVPVIKAADQVPTILSDTEEFYLEQISKAIQEGDKARAMSLVEEAKRAGSTKAEKHYMLEIEQQQ